MNKQFISSFAKRAARLGLLLLFACCWSYPVSAHLNPGQKGNLIRRLTFTVKTGNDDLRGGNDNLNVGINFRDGNVQFKPNVNRGQRWPDNSTQTFSIGLERPVAAAELASIEFQKPTGGGYGTDEWHMTSVSVRAIGDGIDDVIATHGFMQFDRANQALLIPVTIATPGKANKLELTIKTGGDDLRGGTNNLDLSLHFHNAATQLIQDVNAGQEWANGSTHVKTITLDHTVDPSEIVKMDLTISDFMLSSVADNWDMDSLSVRALGDGVDKVIVRHGFFRFTQTLSTLSIPITRAEPGKANKLELTIRTGSDDLRGDNDNLNVIVHFRDGHTQVVRNVNGGKAWTNGSLHVETITLDRATDPKDIIEVDLQTTFTGGVGGDNWNMGHVTVKAVGEDVDEVLFKRGAKRFTGDDKILRLTRKP